MKNPFDRRSKDQRAIDDAVVGLAQPSWSESTTSEATQYVRLALDAWRQIVGNADAQRLSEAKRLDRVRSVVDRRPGSRKLDPAESARIKAIRASASGRIAVAAVVIATAIEELDVWTAHEVSHRVVRIDLSEEIAAIARSAYLLEKAVERLDAPVGHLAKDDDVMRIYRERQAALADRQQVLIGRLSALRNYYDGLAAMQRELERMRWIQKHSEPDAEEMLAREGDELGSMTLTAARDMFDEATGRLSVQMQEAVERLRGEASSPRE
ncbi:hypothetical protein GCM10007304_11100 [Rhodococcoides trifolii]|uniref:Uncharacterized protein n=1 Tax=Rhodococcoides trifolii TaxID=908250 RepID=A0A917CTE3_9NOCA|nr:hypothetical protein [Rhodococcus trifolii]GGF98967.1 hypothetical protein GCM10007304_11100 [Rhodococcus trifolii]